MAGNVARSDRIAVVSTFSGMLNLARDTLCAIRVHVPYDFCAKHNMARRASKFDNVHCKYLRYAIGILQPFSHFAISFLKRVGRGENDFYTSLLTIFIAIKVFLLTLENFLNVNVNILHFALSSSVDF